MSYLKLPKTTSDHAVGLQSLNQAIDNNEALLTAFDAKHSIGVGGNSPYGAPTRAIGRHDDPLIARTVADFYVDTSVQTPVLTMRVGGPVFGALRYLRIATGQWRIYIATAQLFGAVALTKASATVDYKANCYISYDPTTGPAVTVSTWDINSGAVPSLEDLNFSLVIWTQLP